MSALTEFLKVSGRHWKEAAPERAASLVDWQLAVERLYSELTEWVQLADPDGLLAIERTEIERIEARLGRYRIPALTITFGPRWVHVVPVARDVITRLVPEAGGDEQLAAGCVAITDSPSLDSLSPSYRLYRLITLTGDRWFISAGGTSQRELTRDTFEGVLVGLLK